MAAENNGKKLLNTKFEKNEKQNDDYFRFGSTDDKYDRIQVSHYVICR